LVGGPGAIAARGSLGDVRDARVANHSPDLRIAVAIEPCASNYLSLEKRS
jgi:hypothetical protein